MKQFILHYNNSVVYFFLIMIAFFPVLPTGVESVLMFTGFLFSLLYFIFEGKNFWSKEKTTQLLLFSTLFIIFAFSLLYSDDINTGIKFVVRLLPTVLFPVIFLFNDKNFLNATRFSNVTSIYCLAVVLILIFLHLALFHELYNSDLRFWDFRQHIESKIKVHGTYLAMWVGFAIIVLVYKIKSKTSSKKYPIVFLMIFMISYFFYWQYIIGSRMPFVATIIVCFFCLFKNPKQMIIATFFVIVLTIILVSKVDRLGERFEKLKTYNFSFPEGKYEDNYPNISNEQIRNGIYYCSYETLKLEPILGYGIGDADAKLQSCYDEKFTNTDTYKIISYNSHNEYLNIILSSGILGLVLFLFSQYYFLKKALNRKIGIYISFLLFIFLNFCFENILSRHDGVIFFGFFNSLLFFQNRNLNEKSTN
ncbi:O-antigen ligase [Flavobacterium sp. ov086]|uniref:O-antigen ligase family protein n=1 Tax=Flavobacterium sp. ov086 TaxID=1761785 RepID=UPI000B68B235|nr:O-antigen ligase family protein [Flavobacterium sp. ov086]SNR87920.1 O-antigen ligase [Flavobacterium sp. ov086]